MLEFQSEVEPEIQQMRLDLHLKDQLNVNKYVEIAQHSQTFFILSCVFICLLALISLHQLLLLRLCFSPLSPVAVGAIVISDPLLPHNHNCSVTRGPLQLSWSAVTL